MRRPRLLKDVRGVAAIEYGLIAALISLAAIGAISVIGNKTTNNFNGAGAALR